MRRHHLRRLDCERVQPSTEQKEGGRISVRVCTQHSRSYTYVHVFARTWRLDVEEVEKILFGSEFESDMNAVACKGLSREFYRVADK